MTIANKTQTTADLRKVQYAQLVWRTKEGVTRRTKPRNPTVHGQEFPTGELIARSDETRLEYAVAHDLLDKWEPWLYLKFSANSKLVYRGDRALSLWKAYNEMIFNS